MAAKHVRIRNVSIPDVEKPICPTHKRVMVYNNAKAYWNCTSVGCKKIARPVDEDTQLELDLPAITTDTLTSKPLVIKQSSNTVPLQTVNLWEALTSDHVVNVSGFAPSNADGTPSSDDLLTRTREDLHNMVDEAARSMVGKGKAQRRNVETACRIRITNLNGTIAQQEFTIETEEGTEVDITPIIRDFVHGNGGSMITLASNLVDLQWG